MGEQDTAAYWDGAYAEHRTPAAVIQPFTWAVLRKAGHE